MANKHSTRTPTRAQLLDQFHQTSAEIAGVQRELLRFFAQMQQLCGVSRRLGRRLYRLLKDQENRLAELHK